MVTTRFTLEPLAEAGFGACLRFDNTSDLPATVSAQELAPDRFTKALGDAHGLLVLPGMQQISIRPDLLVRLSRLFGDQVENYRETITPPNMIHEQVPEIMLVSNRPPVNLVPPQLPDPPRAQDGGVPVQFPHRSGWHTDQSFRRPPPDISLFYAHIPTPKGQGQTMFADGVAAYDELPASLGQRVVGLRGLHAVRGAGRTEEAVRAGQKPEPLLSHQQSQAQPVVRVHPVTGKRALYLCASSQMDWVDGPFLDMETGPDGDGARLLYDLMAHYTERRFTYVHDWDPGDLIVYDNRCLVHAGSWHDAEHPRVMWRTTVMGNPGEEYAGERPSWIPQGGGDPMDGLTQLDWNTDELNR